MVLHLGRSPNFTKVSFSVESAGETLGPVLRLYGYCPRHWSEHSVLGLGAKVYRSWSPGVVGEGGVREHLSTTVTVAAETVFLPVTGHIGLPPPQPPTRSASPRRKVVGHPKSIGPRDTGGTRTGMCRW